MRIVYIMLTQIILLINEGKAGTERAARSPRPATPSAFLRVHSSPNPVLPFVNDKGKQIATEKVMESSLTPAGFMADARRVRQPPATPSPRLSSSSTTPKHGSGNRPHISSYRDETGLNFTLSPLGSGVKKHFVLHNGVYAELEHHQTEGLAWLWRIHCCGTGGLLADDMGLGKTRQILAFTVGLLQSKLIKKVLIAVPAVVVDQWKREMTEVGLQKYRYIFKDQKTRRQELAKVCELGGVLLTTHTLATNNWSMLNVQWDYMIIDEAHKTCSKSSLKAYKNLNKIDSRHRILITGTPAPNNLKELRALFDFCCPGLFNSMKDFNESFLEPLMEGNYEGSSSNQLNLSSKASKKLQDLIRPCFLRRMKKVLSSSDTPEDKRLKIPEKAEFVVWLKLTPYQEMLYRTFLSGDIIEKGNQGEIMVAATVLQKICNHPKELDIINEERLSDNERVVLKRMIGKLKRSFTYDQNMSAGHSSCKLDMILILLERFKVQQHKVVIFSRTCEMLDVIQELLAKKKYLFSRIDGCLSNPERDKRVKDFKKDDGPPIFLISSFCGGTGLDLPVASRAIIVEPFWNPSVDDQCADRIYRLGQKKECIIYRLISSETIEETVYKTQIFKLGVFKSATESKDFNRYIARELKKEIFEIPSGGFSSSRTLQKLQNKSEQAISEQINAELQFLKNGNIVGVSIHNQLFEGAPNRETKQSVVPVPPSYETNWVIDDEEELRKAHRRKIIFREKEIRKYEYLFQSSGYTYDDDGGKILKVINQYKEELAELYSHTDPKDQT